MNVFACDDDPELAAQALADRHVVKMALESAQMFSTVAALEGKPTRYRMTHPHHPCVVAIRHNPHYRAWAYQHGLALCEEYTWRYHREHAALSVLLEAGALLDVHAFPSLEGAPMAMPSVYRTSHVPTAYRLYLAAKYHTWGHLARWKKRPRPAWS